MSEDVKAPVGCWWVVFDQEPKRVAGSSSVGSGLQELRAGAYFLPSASLYMYLIEGL